MVNNGLGLTQQSSGRVTAHAFFAMPKLFSCPPPLIAIVRRQVMRSPIKLLRKPWADNLYD